MFVFLLSILVIAYVVLKTLNMRARFEERDREREMAEQAANEEAAEFAEISENAVDVEAETKFEVEAETAAEAKAEIE